MFNLILARTGYVAPSLVDGVTVAAQQSSRTIHGILWSYYGVEVIGTLGIIGLFVLLRVERDLRKRETERKES